MNAVIEKKLLEKDTEHFVTLFDSFFLPQGLALHSSMECHIKKFTLWVLCMDDEVYNSLTKLDLPNIKLLRLSELETPELLAVKPTRSIGEYCWTLTPFSPKFVFDADLNVSRVTYLDADMWFRKNPIEIFREFEDSGKDVLITDHSYAPEYDLSAVSGQYCVQFMTFKREGGEVVRKWWEMRCIEWCYASLEDGKFGDQKYLDDWPERFEKQVHVLQNKEWMLAPWNALRFPYGNSILYHFHGLRLLKNKKVNLARYKLPKVLIQYVYQPYLDSIKNSISKLEDNGFIVKIQQENESMVQKVKNILLGLYMQLWTFNIRHYKKL